MRVKIDEMVAQEEKKKKEEKLRQLAQEARDERAGIRSRDRMYLNSICTIKQTKHCHNVLVTSKVTVCRLQEQLQRNFNPLYKYSYFMYSKIDYRTSVV